MSKPSLFHSLVQGVARLLAGPVPDATEQPMSVLELATRENVESRTSPRVPLGIQAVLRMHGEAPVSCVVVDASREGVRISTAEPVPLGTFADIEIPFNGQRLRTGLRILWSDLNSGKFTLGACLLSERAGASIMNDFARYLRWRSSLRRKAA